MDQSEDQLAAGHPVTAEEWLPPSAALARFEPPEGMHLAGTGQPRKEARARYGFRIGELGLLINPDTGSEVLAVSSITPLPDAPPGFLGLINVRGNLVPIYELRVLLGLGPRKAGGGTKVLVFGQGDEAVGIAIDSYPGALTSLRPLPNMPLLPEALRAHVPAGYMQGETVWLEFEHSSFFDEICCGNSLTTIAG